MHTFPFWAGVSPQNYSSFCMAKYGLNRVTLVGNLGKDPEVRHLEQGGIAVATLRMACTERFRDKEGAYSDRTQWVNVTLWRGQAELAGRYLHKGSTVCIEGRLIERTWETPEGEKRSRLEVEGTKLILLDRPEFPAGDPMQPLQDEHEPDILADDLPF
jgi:single-strand DNA-binding protein